MQGNVNTNNILDSEKLEHDRTTSDTMESHSRGSTEKFEGDRGNQKDHAVSEGVVTECNSQAEGTAR